VPHALIVEDDPDSAEVLAELVAAEGFSTAVATSLKEARDQLLLREPDIVLLDLVLPDGSGMDLFEDAGALPNTEIVLTTGHASLETSIQALRFGATDYLTKPVNLKHLKGILSRITRPADLKAEIADLRADLERVGRFGRLWGRSGAMRKAYDQIARVSGTSVAVMVTGESGTGKELVAQTIHELSRRRGQPFLAVNCSAIPRELIESEMFGHEKGSFTGASRQHRGYFERAHGGTLFLDEVTEMPLELQPKLLRVLETGTFVRVGSDQLVEADVRIIAATNRVPSEAVEAGKLREDLFYRLNVFPLQLPPLRERLEDVELLAQHFLDEIGRAENEPKRFAPQALEQLRRYDWPGNVRELRNAVQRAYIMAEGATIDAECLPLDPRAARRERGPFITVRVGTSIAEAERRLIFATLEHCGGHREKTAEILGVSMKTLYNRLREYGGDEGAQPRGAEVGQRAE
jgi:DNA-binding NtrC family response regulator